MDKIINERYTLNAKGVVVAKVDISPSVKKGMVVGGAKGLVVVKGQTLTLDAVKDILNKSTPETKPAKAVAPKSAPAKAVETKPAKAVATKAVETKPANKPKGEGYSNVKGINFDKVTGRYQIRYVLNGRQVYVGIKDTEEEAIEAQKKLGKLYAQHYEAKRPDFDSDVEFLKALYTRYLKNKKVEAVAPKTAPVKAVATKAVETKPAKAVATKAVAKKTSKKEIDEL